MAKNKRATDPIKDLTDLTKKLLVLELFKAGVSKESIRKKLRMNANEVSSFLKGVNNR